MWKLKTSDAKKKGVAAARAVMISMAIIRGGGVSGGVAAARPLRDFGWPVPFISFYHFCFVLFGFVVYRWTAVNDKRLRGRYLKWASAIPLVRGYETQKQQASKSERRRRRRRSSVQT